MANLFEINRALIEAWEAAIDQETGEISEEGMAIISQLEMDQATKRENIACWIKNLRSDAAALKAESKNMADRAKSAENKADSLTRYLAADLNGQKFQTPKVAIGWRRSESVQVDANAVLPEEFIRRKITEEPAKDEIKKALKAGVAVPGCRLVESNNISIK